jgi:hypothetical protein
LNGDPTAHSDKDAVPGKKLIPFCAHYIMDANGQRMIDMVPSVFSANYPNSIS